MKITLARHSGFCMGVRNALIRIVRELNSSREELYIYGPLIHNPQTIDVLNDRGLRTVTTIDDLAGKAVAIRTHGIPNDERLILRKCASRVINLTCPRVAKVQSIIKKHSSKRAHTVITGDRDHAEVKSLVSYAHHGATVISDIEETDSLPVADSYLVISQTTFDRDLFLAIAGRISESIDDFTVFATICDSTRLRQEDVVRGIFDGNDTLIVVGGKNSANTRRLAQIGRDRNILTFHIETEHELSIDDFRNAKNVLVTAGTSTPGWIINNVLDRLYTIDLGTRNLFLRSLIRFFEFAVRSNLISSAAAFFMTLTTLAYSGIPIDYTLPLISFLYIFSMYSINNLFEKKLLKFSNPFKYEIYRKYGSPLMALSIASMAASVLLAYHYNYATASLVAGACLLGIVYSSAPVKKLIRLLPFASLKSLYSSKTVTAFGWSIITVLVPM
ncbi:MAG: 4-hydroxy-3-methylbut-2-enyl diphosphate reductase, partial [Chrysiogenales bacterium]